MLPTCRCRLNAPDTSDMVKMGAPPRFAHERQCAATAATCTAHRQHLLSVSDFALFSALAYESEASLPHPKA